MQKFAGQKNRHVRKTYPVEGDIATLCNEIVLIVSISKDKKTWRRKAKIMFPDGSLYWINIAMLGKIND